MRRVGSWFLAVSAVVSVVILGLELPGVAYAHCDTMNGPVVRDARRALESGDIAPVLKWIRPADESAIREAFKSASSVRKQSDQARDLADRYFFETVVRIHRAGEGASYEGLKPADAIPASLVTADQALASGSVEEVARDISTSVAAEVRKRFQVALQRKAHADESPEAGRRFVAAYVEYVHFIEEVDSLVGGEVHGHEGHD